MSEYEARPTRDRLERVISALSIKTSQIKSAGGGGTPDLEPCHYAGMLAGMRGEPWLVKTAEHLLMFVYLHDRWHRKPLERVLLAWLSNRILIKHPELQISGSEVREVISVGLDACAAGGAVTYADAARRGIKRKRWDRLRAVYSLMLDRIGEAEFMLLDHLRKTCT